MTSTEWVEQFKKWYPETHVIWRIIEDLRVREQELKPMPPPVNHDLDLWC